MNNEIVWLKRNSYGITKNFKIYIKFFFKWEEIYGLGISKLYSPSVTLLKIEGNPLKVQIMQSNLCNPNYENTDFERQISWGQ